MKSLDRYVLRFFATSYVICLLTVIGLFILGDSFNRIDKFLDVDQPFVLVFAHYYAVLLPMIFHRMAPFITLMAAMFAVTRLGRNNEITPMKACGISIYRILLPVFAGGIAATGLIVLDQELIIPGLANQIQAISEFRTKGEAMRPGVVPDRLGNSLTARLYYPSMQRMEGVIFSIHGENGLTRGLLTAAIGQWIPDGSGRGRWELYDGIEQVFDEEGRILRKDDDSGEVVQRRFQRDVLKTDLRPGDLESLDREVSLLSYRSLRSQIRRQPYAMHLQVQLQDRLSYPLANIVLLLLGLPFVLRGEGRSIVLGLLLCLLICAAFFVTTFFFHDAGNRGQMSPQLAVWLPTSLFLIAGLILFDGVPS